jgi:hypothetical protein
MIHRALEKAITQKQCVAYVNHRTFGSEVMVLSLRTFLMAQVCAAFGQEPCYRRCLLFARHGSNRVGATRSSAQRRASRLGIWRGGQHEKRIYPAQIAA